MNDIRRVAVVDIGKTNAKVTIFDLAAQREVDRVAAPNRPVTAGPYPHHDADALWAFIKRALRELSAGGPIDGIAVAAHGATCALLDAKGDLALPVLDYEYAGVEATARDYESIRPDFSQTGSPRLPIGLNLGAQIFWQAKTFLDQFARVRWIVPYPQFWSYRLSGVLANEVTSLGCHTDLWNYGAADYSDLVDRMGWRALMPPLRKASECLGALTPDVAKETGLSPATPVFCGAHDSNASLFPHLIERQPPFSVVSTGTWVISMGIDCAPGELDAARDILVNVNALGQPVPSARFMGGREFELLSAEFGAAPEPSDVARVLEKRAMLMPSVVGGSGPFPTGKLEWIDKADLTPPQVQVAASFYLALMTATCLRLIGARGPVALEGPFSNNPEYAQMLSAATGRIVSIDDAASAGVARGAALLCDPVKRPAPPRRSVQVDEPAWRDYAAQWAALAEARADGAKR